VTFAEFRVPVREAGSSAAGRWFWRLAHWPGVRRARLGGLFGCLEVEATPRAMRRVRSFCTRRGYREVSP
jgi:hypothetical protein